MEPSKEEESALIGSRAITPNLENITLGPVETPNEMGTENAPPLGNPQPVMSVKEKLPPIGASKASAPSLDILVAVKPKPPVEESPPKLRESPKDSVLKKQQQKALHDQFILS